MKEMEMGQDLKLAAIDLDGTLLGHEGKISDANASAVRRLQSAGIHVALASGRHYVNMQKYAESLPGVEWLVSCQGGELSDVARECVLGREFVSQPAAAETVALGHSLGFSTLIYSIDGVVTDSDWNGRTEFYTDLAGRAPEQIAKRSLFNRPIFKILWIGEPPAIEAAIPQAAALASIQGVRTHQRLLEFMPVGVSKASALKILAQRLNIDASQTVAFGDGDNDVPMFEWAGLSVAMAHGWPAALGKATHVSPEGPSDSALARGVDLVLGRKIDLSSRPVHRVLATSAHAAV